MPWIGVREIPTDGERGSSSESGVLSTWMGVRVISLVGERGSNERNFFWRGGGVGGTASSNISMKGFVEDSPIVEKLQYKEQSALR